MRAPGACLPWFSPQLEVDRTCCHYSKENQSNYLTSDKADFRTRNVTRDKKHIICDKVVNSPKKKFDAVFCVDRSVLLLWVNSKDHDC